MSVLRSVRSTFPLLWDDERSAMRLGAAVLASLVVLAAVATGLLLISLADDVHRDRARGTLWALHEGPAATPPA